MSVRSIRANEEGCPVPTGRIRQADAGVRAGDLRGWVSNIQHYAVHDGPGIRTTVFLQGCPLRCAWCCNPEMLRLGALVTWWEDRCIGCDVCRRVCPAAAVEVDEKGRRRVLADRCDLCGRCLDGCYSGALEQVGKLMTVTEVLTEVLADEIFYDESHGGMTLSGGEPSAQSEFCLGLLPHARARHIHTAIETSGHAPWSIWELLLPYVDLVLYDIKEVDPERHARWTGISNALILENLRRMVETGTRVIVRRPVIPGYNDDEGSLRSLGGLMRQLGLRELHLLPYHRLGEGKYERLEQKYRLGGVPSLTPADVVAARDLLLTLGVAAKIGG